MESVGVRELRQNASVLLDRLQATGESIEITNHGRPVAHLVPVTSAASSRAELIRAGMLRPGRGDPLAVPPAQGLRGGPSTDELLRYDRDDR
jgi:prevent-host-death family protein